ncbi:glycosyltransferase family 4 protein [Wohlfahrtiimonas chitiniclastica]|uniref:glycosyltransferase family 4 protein n=1 Tax=Wohlfahrtiimonas chitiniclastica TaxID=400946 RepID=UPI0007B699F9|nr:glycosyltransferase family 4 protein [Wohlfahrtiimonas chitiniclastica]KZX36410.1 glycosyl transferase [Wohlfahrtiimonas chitiniclastica]
MKKILVIASLANSFLGFRKPLLLALVNRGLKVHVAAPLISTNIAVNKELKKYGIITHDIAMQRTGVNPLSDLKTTIDLYSLMKKIQPDLTLGYTIKPVIYGNIAAWCSRVPRRYALITGLGYAFQESADNNQRKIIRSIVQGLYRFALNKTSSVFFQNPDDEALFRERKILTEKTPSFVVNGSGVDLNEYPETSLNNSKIRFLFVGRLLGDKGIREYIKAAEIIKKQYQNIEIDIVGSLDINPDAIQQPELDSWIESGAINYFGKLNDVRPRIADASVFILPSYREGVPRSTLEAMSMGRAIITTDAPGCKETVIDGENGFLVPVKNSELLVNAMEKFILNPELIKSMGKKSRMIAEEKFDVKKVNQQMLQGMELL